MKKLWFRAKLFGWGWYPVSWEGWFVTLIFVGFVAFLSVNFLDQGRVMEYFLYLAVGIAILIYIGYKTGEKPRFRWGR